MTELQKELNQAFAVLATFAVSGDAVDRMAMAREHLRRAYKLAGETEPEQETEVNQNGG